MRRIVWAAIAGTVLALGAAPARAQEAMVWAEAANNCDKLRAYAKDYPKGRFAGRVPGELQRLNCPDPEADARRAAEARQREAEARRQAEQRAASFEAENRRLRDELALAKAKPPIQSPAVKAKPAAFSLEWLHPEVRAAVVSARAAEQQADRVAADARAVAVRAQDSAARARRAEAGKKGYVYTSVSNNQVRYEGDWANGQQNGNGVLTVLSGKAVGDVYAGQFKNDQYNGLGVLAYGQNEANTSKSTGFEGSWLDGNRSGFGAYRWQNGNRFAGAWLNGRRAGPGVLRFPNGNRNEGEYATDLQNGPGVRWRADGTPAEQGAYKDGNLATPLTSPP
jgi:hypothetical protein